MKLVQKLVAIGVVLCATVAFAAPPKEDKKPKQFDFEVDEINVDVLKPDATMVEVLRAKASQSLIRLRMDFIKEIVKSAEDL